MDGSQIAIQQNRTILTFDRDYGELIFKHNIKPPGGVIYLRFKEFSPLFPGQIISEILHRDSFSVYYALTVIDGSGIRQRLYESPG
jgi:predicted nuclease of predicted toxin-antitoxin system